MMNLIIHHWDTDGIASAVILSKQLGESFSYFTPPPGNYFLSEYDREEIKKRRAEKIYLVDMSLPEDDLKFLNSISDFQVYDHHSGRLIEDVKIKNPILLGAKSTEYPSCTTVLKEEFGLKEDILIWSGVWGDIGFKLKEDDSIFVNLKNFLNENNIDFDDFKLFVSAVDYQYKTGDREKVYAVIDFLLKNSPLDILNKKEFTEVIKEVEKAKEEEFLKFTDYGKLTFLHTKSPYYIISDLCRMKYKETPEKYNVVIGEREHFFNFYLRTISEDLSPLVKRVKEAGYFGGGKTDVLGVVIERENFSEFLDFINDFFIEREINLKDICKEHNIFFQ